MQFKLFCIPFFLKVLLFSALTLQGAQADELPAPPNLAVKSYLLKDFNNDYSMASSNAQQRVEPASLTKIMTAYLSFKAIQNNQLQLTQRLAVSQAAWGMEGSKMFIEPKKPVTVDELLHGLIVQSGNDAAIALAEGMAGTEKEFAVWMNKEAQRLGMQNTHFMNATGLPDAQHYTTAEDLYLLASALIRDFPKDYARLYALKEYTYNGITQSNRNRLLWLDPNVDGMKTGHTESAGYCLVATAKRDTTRFISIVIGAPTELARATESQKLLNYGFQNFESQRVYQQGQNVKSLKVWKGIENEVIATVPRDLYLTIPRGEYANIKASLSSMQPLMAPIKKGQVIGKVSFSLNGKLVRAYDLTAQNEVSTAGFFGRTWDTLKLLLQ